MIRFMFRLLGFAAVAVFGAALAAKFALESHAEPETQEIDMVAIFEGRTLISSADPFFGGKVLVMCGGALIDLRKATPAPTGVELDLAVIWGGVSLVVPEGWRVDYVGEVYGGGVADNTRTTADDDVPVVKVKGFVAMGGFQATTKSPLEVVA